MRQLFREAKYMKTYGFNYTITGCWSVEADNEVEAMELAETYMDDTNDDHAEDEWVITRLE